DGAASRSLAPFDVALAVVHAARARKPLVLARVLAILEQEAPLVRRLPERLGFRIDIGTGERSLDFLGFTHGHCSRISTLDTLQFLPYGITPIPVTIALRGSATWRSPPSPNIWRTASTRF